MLVHMHCDIRGIPHPQTAEQMAQIVRDDEESSCSSAVPPLPDQQHRKKEEDKGHSNGPAFKN